MKRMLFITALFISELVMSQGGFLSTSIETEIGVGGVTIPTRRNYIHQRPSSKLEDFEQKQAVVANAQLGAFVHALQSDYFDFGFYGQFGLGWMFADSYKSYDYGYRFKLGIKKFKVVYGQGMSYRKTFGYLFTPTSATTYKENLSHSVYDSIAQTEYGIRLNFEKSYMELHYLRDEFQDLSSAEDSLIAASGIRFIFGNEKWNLNTEVIYRHPSRGYLYVSPGVIDPEIKMQGIYAKCAFSRVIEWRKFW